MNIDPRIIGVLVDVGHVLWNVVAGTPQDRKEAALAIAEAALQAGLEEAKRRAEQLGIVIAALELDLAMQRMLAAIRAAADHPTIAFSNLLDMEEVGPDEKIVDTQVAEVDTGETSGNGGSIVLIESKR